MFWRWKSCWAWRFRRGPRPFGFLLCELQRIASHLLWLGTHAHDIGAMTPLFYALRERDEILFMFEMVCGSRLTPSYFRVGGLAQDLPDGFEEKCREFTRTFPPMWTNTKRS